MLSCKSCRSLVFLLLATPSALHAQASGTVTGRVVAPDHAPVVAAHVNLVGMDASPYLATTSADGTFTLNNLASGTYTLQVEAPGFALYRQTPVVVAVGRSTQLTVALAIASAQQTVSVTAVPSSFDPAQTSSVVNIDRDRIEELPIPNRNYLTFVLLSPQVAAANPALTQQTLAQSTGGFSFGGLRPGSNAVYLDDVNDDDEFTGGSRTQLSPEAISDFQIVNHGFNASAGGGAGGSIDVQTRAGLNRLHGDAFTFIQNGIWNATPALTQTPVRPVESRVRAGVSAGGPIRRDRTFFFFAAEQELAHGQEASELRGATRTAIDTALAQYAPLQRLSLQSGFFPTTDQETELSGRLDHTYNASESILLRYAFTNTRNVADAFHTDELTDFSARGSSFTADNSFNSTLTSIRNAHLLNRFSFELAQRRAVERTGSTTGPGVIIAGVASFGTPYAGNGRRVETHCEFADSLSWQRGRHLIGAGARFDHVSLRASVPEGAQGLFVFADLPGFQAGRPDFFSQSFGTFDRNFAALRTALYLQDHWALSPRLTLDYGLRYDLNHLPAGLPQDALHLSPRLGLAFTPSQSLVLRAGFGLFYDRFQLATINRLLTFDGAHAISQIVEDTAATAVFQSGRIPAEPLALVAPSISRVQPGLRNPYSVVGSFSVEQALPFQTTLTAEYQSVQGVRLGRTGNINLAPPVSLNAANAASLGIASPVAQQRGRLIFSPVRLNPAYDAINEFATAGHSTYRGLTITLNRQFQDDLQILAGYTDSTTTDDASYDGEQPANPYAPRGERARSLEDQRHRFTLSGLYLIGPDLGDAADAVKNAHPGPIMKLLNGLEFAPIVSIASGFRANPLTGLDSSREHIFPFAARPAGLTRNSLATPFTVNVDLRVLKIFPVRRGHLDIVAESFNLLNHRNTTLLNTAFGSASSPVASFGRPIATASARRLQFSLDYEF